MVFRFGEEASRCRLFIRCMGCLGQFRARRCDHDRECRIWHCGSAEFREDPDLFSLGRGETSGRWNIAKGEGVDDYPQLAEFAHGGGTDHLVSLLEFPKEAALRGVSLSLTSDRPGGFSDDQLAIVAKLSQRWGWLVIVLRHRKPHRISLPSIQAPRQVHASLQAIFRGEREGRSMLRSCLRT